MKKWSISIFIILALVVAPWMSVTPARAGAERTEITALDATCSITPGVQWISGSVLHVRNEVDIKRTVSSDPLVNGTNTVLTNYDIDLNTGSGGGWGTFVFRPDQVNGTWKGSFAGPLTAGVFSSRGVGKGTGALKKMEIKVSFQGIPVPADQPCAPAPAFDADQIQGRILSIP